MRRTLLTAFLAAPFASGPLLAVEPIDRVTQPVHTQVVPDADGLPWRIEIRPSVTLAQAREAAAAETAGDDGKPTIVPNLPTERTGEPAPNRPASEEPATRNDAASRKKAAAKTNAAAKKKEAAAKRKAEADSRRVQAAKRQAEFERQMEARRQAEAAKRSANRVPQPDASSSNDAPAANAVPEISPEPATLPDVPPLADNGSTTRLPAIIPQAQSEAAKDAIAYRDAFRALPHSAYMESIRPGFRHELAVLLATGETLPPASPPAGGFGPGGFGPTGYGFGGFDPGLIGLGPGLGGFGGLGGFRGLGGARGLGGFGTRFGGFGLPGSVYQNYIPAQWDYYQTSPPVFRLINPFLYGPGGLGY